VLETCVLVIREQCPESVAFEKVCCVNCVGLISWSLCQSVCVSVLSVCALLSFPIMVLFFFAIPRSLLPPSLSHFSSAPSGPDAVARHGRPPRRPPRSRQRCQLSQELWLLACDAPATRCISILLCLVLFLGKVLLGGKMPSAEFVYFFVTDRMTHTHTRMRAHTSLPSAFSHSHRLLAHEPEHGGARDARADCAAES
jgi:hypothetical protein